MKNKYHGGMGVRMIEGIADEEYSELAWACALNIWGEFGEKKVIWFVSKGVERGSENITCTSRSCKKGFIKCLC